MDDPSFNALFAASISAQLFVSQLSNEDAGMLTPSCPLMFWGFVPLVPV
jgi:hypothetical protein